ncbi:MAG: hypothetical protein RIT81_40235 [Deltaproteobacteria bacterium]
MAPRCRFKVAFSFAGDNKRERVRQIAELVRDRLGNELVFFDEWFEHETLGLDAQVVLQRIYNGGAWLVVVGLCNRYDEKPWTQEEWRAIQDFERTLRDAGGENVKRLRLLPLRFGDGEVEGLFGTALVKDVREADPATVADLVVKRFEASKPPSWPDMEQSDEEPTTSDDVTESASESETQDPPLRVDRARVREVMKNAGAILQSYDGAMDLCERFAVADVNALVQALVQRHPAEAMKSFGDHKRNSANDAAASVVDRLAAEVLPVSTHIQDAVRKALDEITSGGALVVDAVNAAWVELVVAGNVGRAMDVVRRRRNGRNVLEGRAAFSFREVGMDGEGVTMAQNAVDRIAQRLGQDLVASKPEEKAEFVRQVMASRRLSPDRPKKAPYYLLVSKVDVSVAKKLEAIRTALPDLDIVQLSGSTADREGVFWDLLTDVILVEDDPLPDPKES